MKNNIESDREKIAVLFKKYVNIILNEYGSKIPAKIREKLTRHDDFTDMIEIADTGTISLYVTNDMVLHLPLDGYNAMEELSRLPLYGSDKSHRLYNNDNMIINDNTFESYVEHVILKGLPPLEYFKECLLHEIMHICGSRGGSALSEGFTELKTRELAFKYNLESSCSGYPKEVRIAHELQKLFGKELCDELVFLDFKSVLDLLDSRIGPHAKKLYINIYKAMEEQFVPYIAKRYPGLNGIKNKCETYDKLNYDFIYELIDQYRLNIKK